MVWNFEGGRSKGRQCKVLKGASPFSYFLFYSDRTNKKGGGGSDWGGSCAISQ